MKESIFREHSKSTKKEEIAEISCESKIAITGLFVKFFNPNLQRMLM